MEELNYDGLSAANERRPNDLLVWSILSTIFCCLVTGIVAIVYSSKVNSLWDAGDHAGSVEAARKAKIWNLVGLGLGLLGFIIGVVCMLVGVAAVNEAGGFDEMAEMLNQMNVD